MAQEKRYLRGKCQESGCPKRVRHLRGHAKIRVAWIDYVIKAFCGEHTREWDARVEQWAQNLGPDDPRAYMPNSVINYYQLKAEQLAAETEAAERAERSGRKACCPILESIDRHNRAQPSVVRLA